MLKAGYWGAMIRSRRLLFFFSWDSETWFKRFNSFDSFLFPFLSRFFRYPLCRFRRFQDFIRKRGKVQGFNFLIREI